MKSKIIELEASQVDDKSSDQGECYVGDGLNSLVEHNGIYSQLESISKRKNMANDSKASVYFTPSDSIDPNQLQLSPIHINYIRENLDSYMGCMKPPPLTPRQLFFQQRQIHSADDDGAVPMTSRMLVQTYTNDCAGAIVNDDDSSETESTIMIGAENDSSNEDNCATKPHTDYIPMNILCKNASKIRCDSKDLYYSLENVFDTKSSPIQLSNDLTVDEVSDVQTSNSSASDNCIVGDEHTNTDWTNGKVTPEKEITTNTNPSTSRRYVHRVDSAVDFNEMYPSSSLPNINRTISALAEVHCSKDYNGSQTIEPTNTQQSTTVNVNNANGGNRMIETV